MTIQNPTEVIVHPLVLLSVVDHYNRIAKNTKKRVVGVLLGQQIGNKVNIANSYAGIKQPKKYHLKKTRRILLYGFWIIIIMKQCMICVEK
jgi:hypothetical protein